MYLSEVISDGNWSLERASTSSISAAAITNLSFKPVMQQKECSVKGSELKDEKVEQTYHWFE